MSAPALRCVWYRFRATFTRRRGGYIAVVLVVGLLGGLAMGALAAARRTQSAFSSYLASTDPSDLRVLTGLYGSQSHSPGFDRDLIRTISRLPGVARVRSYGGVDAAVMAPNGAVAVNAVGSPGSIDGEYFDQDRVTIVQGRMADPQRTDEVVVDAKGTPARVHIGDVVPLAFFTNAQEQSAGFGSPRTKPFLRVDAKVVGKAVFSSELVQDDVDTGLDGGPLFTPALTQKLAACCVDDTETAIRLVGGSRDVARVEGEIEKILPRGLPVVFYASSATAAKANRAIRPAASALAVFGGIAALAALVIAAQVIGRQLRLDREELETLRALGAGRAMTVGDGLPGVLGAIVVGSLLAVVVAVGLSAPFPLGLVRPVYPHPGIAFDWTVLGAGAVTLIAVLALTAMALAYRRAPGGDAKRQPSRRRVSRITRRAASSGASASAVTGIRFALDPGVGRDPVPVRSAIMGTVLAMTVVVATVVFGSSLATLVTHPSLYGWNWTYAVSPGFPPSIPQQRAAAVLDHRPGVAAWSGVYFATLRIDGQAVPVLGMTPKAPVAPPILSGHGLEAPDQVVLGSVTLAHLQKHLGDTVEVRSGPDAPTRLRIVGTATMPSIGINGSVHPEMGTGAQLSSHLIPEAAGSGPNDVFVRLRPGADRERERRALQRLVSAGSGGVVLAVQRPAEIVNYRSMGTTPALLGAALALGAVGALALTLIASVRRRRRDLALLKTLGFTHRQLAAVVAWQSTVAVAVGVIIGVPLGVVVGRLLWDAFANEIHVVPASIAPMSTIALIALGALLLANVAATIPARRAARTPTALLLHAE
jgi:hypothetical protein